MSLLSSSVGEGYAGNFLYTNTQTDSLPQQKVTLQREVVLSDLLWERIILQNFHNVSLEVELNLSFQSDFADIFEVRGLNVPERGQRMVPVVGKNGRTLFLAYRGLDGALVETVIEFFGAHPQSIDEHGQVVFKLVLPVHAPSEFQISFFDTGRRQDGRSARCSSYGLQ